MLQRLFMNILLLFKAFGAPTAFGVCARVEDGAGRVLLVRHGYRPGWHFPGGGVDRHELPATAILRELREEIGLTACAPPEFLGLYSGRHGAVRNLVALYRVHSAEFAFKPGLEIREAKFFAPDDLPPDTSPGVRRRLAEFTSGGPSSERW